jgi:hypothetical protein
MSASRLTAAAVLVAAVAAVAATPSAPACGGYGQLPAAKPAPASPKPVDLVICLDVSGSMGGLIDSARIKLWDVVNELAKVKPTPTLRVGLYSYGGGGAGYTDGYIRKELDLTNDLDAVYEKLNALKISGSVEYATGVSKRAIDEQKWSDDKGALKILFVCGNENADQDPKVKYADLGEVAKGKGVIVNSIYCGSGNDGVAPGWQHLAEACGGKYTTIDMNKAKTQVVNTPFDKELNDLSGKLNTTYVMYGADGKKLAENQAAQDKNAFGAGGGAGATRAAAKAGALYRNDSWDLIDRMKNDAKFDLKTVKEEDLPDELKKLKPEERLAYLKKKEEDRAGIQKQIAELSAKRAKHIEDELKKAPKSDGEKALDEALKATIRTQAKDKGFEVPEKK